MSSFFVYFFCIKSSGHSSETIDTMKTTSMKNKIVFATCVLAILTLTNCSPKAFQSGSSSTNSSNNNFGNDAEAPASPGATTPDAISKLDLKGTVDSTNPTLGSGMNGAVAFDFDKVRGEFIVMLPFPGGIMFTPPPGTFSKYPDITFQTMFDAEGRAKLAIRIPIKYVLKGVNMLPAAKLPNGDPLPAMPAGYGELPSLAMSFPQQNNTQITLYIGVNAIGLFATLPDKFAQIPIGFSLPIKNADKSKTFGYLTFVPAKGTYEPGLFLSTLIPPSVARLLEDYFHL